MNLKKLLDTQRILDTRIIKKHNLQGQDLVEGKILALRTELGECANEWRGFKFWSSDRQPRIKKARGPYVNLEDAEFYNPLLEEYVDCLHFVLSIVLELGYEEAVLVKPFTEDSVLEQFNECFDIISDLSGDRHKDSAVYLVSWFLGLGLMLGFTLEQIEQAYFAKNEINHVRQDQGY